MITKEGSNKEINLYENTKKYAWVQLIDNRALIGLCSIYLYDNTKRTEMTVLLLFRENLIEYEKQNYLFKPATVNIESCVGKIWRRTCILVEYND